MGACFCTGACKVPPYHCPASGDDFWNPPYTPWQPDYPPYRDTAPPWKQPEPLPMNNGWKCPACGRGNAPHVDTCPCYSQYNPIIFTIETTDGIDISQGDPCTTGISIKYD